MPSSWYGYLYRCFVDASNSDSFIIKFVNSWIGLSGTAWETPANWSCGSVPDANTDVIISAGTVVLNSNAFCGSLKINPGASFTVNPGYILTITR